jgi:hypothetical protein
MRFTRIRASRSLTISTLVVAFALAFSMVAGSLRQDDAAAQGVDWLSADSISYLTSSGIPVMVPSWIPGPVNGSMPEVYSGGGSYSIYFYAGSSFLYISGVAGGGFPGGSEANLNVQLSVNASVQGWPAIQDIGVPEGTPTPIYDKVMWIADGVLYTVSGNGLDTDSLTLANSSVALYAETPAVPAPVQPEPEIPAPSAPDTAVEQPVSSDASNSQQDQPDTDVSAENTATAPLADTTTTSDTTVTDTGSTETTTAQPTAPSGSSDGTSGPWFTGGLNADPSDGTDGANPPFLGDDGTGGAP